MNTMNAMSKETNKTQAMLYLENKRKMAETGQTTNVSGEKTEIISIPIYKLNTTYTSQRTLRNRRLAENIASNFDKNLFQPIVVSYRDGKWYVIDGQHRLYGAKKRFGDNYLMECQVIRGLTQQEESMYFVKLNDSSIPLQYADKAKGLFYAEDETMTTLANLCKKNGVELGITEDKRTTADSRITAIKALVVTYNKIGEEKTDRLIRLLNDTWDGAYAAFRQEMIKAVGYILNLYSRELDDNKFIKKLSKVNPADLIRMAKSDRITTAKTEAKIARIMVNNYYNKGKGATPLEYKFNF